MSYLDTEILSPAGSFDKLEYAYAYGADAAYIGVPLFSLRARENEFNLEELKKGIELARKMGKKIYVTANIFARNRKIGAFDSQFKEWLSLKPDALIMSDPGLMMMVREKFPEFPIHLSVQANCMNWQSVRFWQKSLNLERVILSRELNITEIKEIRQRVPDIELEAFVHGAICIAYSGRCLMSSYFSHRDANQGVCDNSCREKFKVYGAESKQTEYYIEDLRNQGEFYQIDEDENGTLLMNAKDLCVIEHLKELIDAGVCSLKIEGRTKSEHYVALVTRAYRQALNDLAQGKEFDPNLKLELNKIANRGYSTGFMVSPTGSGSQNYDSSTPRHYSQKFAGLYRQEKQDVTMSAAGFYPFEIRNKIAVGDSCELMGPNMHALDFIIEEIKNLEGQSVMVAHGGTGIFFVKTQVMPDSHSILSSKMSSSNNVVQAGSTIGVVNRPM